MILERFSYGPNGTFGRLQMDGFGCYTVERPWLHNQPRVSCIPEGRYKLVESRFYSGGYDTFELWDVPGRSLVKIHVANRPEELEGCIGLGRSLGCIAGQWAVLESKRAFKDWMRAMEAVGDLEIEIRGVKP